MRILRGGVLAGIVGLCVATACGSSSNSSGSGGSGGSGGSAGTGGRGNENTGQSCQTAADCYPNVAKTDGGDGGAISGVMCLDKVTGGYCTHLCQTDADCCAVPGECRTGIKEVCSPFESTGQMMCFLSCESGDIIPPADAGADASNPTPDQFCQNEAGTDFGCRSTGGGKNNRMICAPVATSDAGEAGPG